MQDIKLNKDTAKGVPVFDGSYSCTSSCGNDYDCPHEPQFDEDNGIVRSGLDFDIKSDKKVTEFIAVIV